MLCVAASLEAIWPIYVIVMFIGSAKAFLGPVSKALLPDLVPPGGLTRGVALTNSFGGTARLLAPALGGLLYMAGPVVPFLAAAVIGSAWRACAASASAPRPPSAPPRGDVADAGGGLRLHRVGADRDGGDGPRSRCRPAGRRIGADAVFRPGDIPGRAVGAGNDADRAGGRRAAHFGRAGLLAAATTGWADAARRGRDLRPGDHRVRPVDQSLCRRCSSWRSWAPRIRSACWFGRRWCRRRRPMRCAGASAPSIR